jgi:hypothetical protein
MSRSGISLPRTRKIDPVRCGCLEDERTDVMRTGLSEQIGAVLASGLIANAERPCDLFVA